VFDRKTQDKTGDLPEGWSSNYPAPGGIISPQGGSATAKPKSSVEYEYRYSCLWYTEKAGEDGKRNSVDHLSSLLKDGWEPVRETPMGCQGNWGGSIMAVAVVLRRVKRTQ
jgi:hypothetical protein